MTSVTIKKEPRVRAQYTELLRFAQRLYQQSPDWVTFFREVMGIDGVIRRMFPNLDDLVQFERSDEFIQIQKLLVKLRESKATADSDCEPTRVITVRLPKSMHESLRTEAHDLRTSMNKLCISKLLQMVEQDMIPQDQVEQDEATELKRRISQLESKLRAYEFRDTSMDYEVADTGPARGIRPR